MELSVLLSEFGIQAGAWAVVILSLIQVSPIQLNPWSAIYKIILIPFKAFGKALTADLVNQMDVLSSDIKEVKNEVSVIRKESDEDKALQRRIRILRFGDDIRSGRLHSLEHFDEILNDISEYEHYCDEHPEFENSRAVMTIKCIEDDYKSRLLTNDFL